jgi:hypothetical protein
MTDEQPEGPRADLDHELVVLARHVPRPVGRLLAYSQRPGARVYRWLLALLLVVGGVLGVLPILGFWMIPLGLALLAQDVPFARPPLARALAFVNARWPRRPQNEA